jgi:LPXTG-motif cell wall-anchored protein
MTRFISVTLVAIIAVAVMGKLQAAPKGTSKVVTLYYDKKDTTKATKDVLSEWKELKTKGAGSDVTFKENPDDPISRGINQLPGIVLVKAPGDVRTYNRKDIAKGLDELKDWLQAQRTPDSDSTATTPATPVAAKETPVTMPKTGFDYVALSGLGFGLMGLGGWLYRRAGAKPSSAQ